MSTLVPTADIAESQSRAPLYQSLGQLLSSAYNLEQLLDTFFFETQAWLYSDGMSFEHIGKSAPHIVGIESTHTCEYKLYARHNYLGELTLTRRTKFDDEELEILEDLIAILLPHLSKLVSRS